MVNYIMFFLSLVFKLEFVYPSFIALYTTSMFISLSPLLISFLTYFLIRYPQQYGKFNVTFSKDDCIFSALSLMFCFVVGYHVDIFHFW